MKLTKKNLPKEGGRRGGALMQFSDGSAVVIGPISMVGQWLPCDKSSDSEQQTIIWSAWKCQDESGPGKYNLKIYQLGTLRSEAQDYLVTGVSIQQSLRALAKTLPSGDDFYCIQLAIVQMQTFSQSWLIWCDVHICLMDILLMLSFVWPPSTLERISDAIGLPINEEILFCILWKWQSCDQTLCLLCLISYEIFLSGTCFQQENVLFLQILKHFAFFAIPKKSWNIAIFPPPAVLSLIHSWTWEKYQTRPSLHISTLTCTLRQGWKWHDISLLTTQMPLSKMI